MMSIPIVTHDTAVAVISDLIRSEAGTFRAFLEQIKRENPVLISAVIVFTEGCRTEEQRADMLYGMALAYRLLLAQELIELERIAQ